MFNNAIRSLSQQADKYAKEAMVIGSKYAKEATQKMNAAMGKEQIVTIGSRQMRVLDLLAEGGYAYVYKAEDVLTGQVLALKRMLIQDEENVGLADLEIDIMKKLQGKPYVIQILGSTKRKIEQPRATEYFVLMELCSGGTLMDLISRQMKRRLDEGRLAAIFYQIVVAVSHLHNMKPPVAHRDLKIENVLIGSSGEMRLCDFGSCTTRAQAYLTRDEMTEEEERIQKYSTSMYRAPEMVDLYKKEVINEKVDIWALGCILYTLAFFTQPFQEGGNLQIIGGQYAVPEDNKYSKHVMLIIKKCLALSPKKRADIRKLLAMMDRWIKELRKNGETVNIPKPDSAAKKKKKSKKDDSDGSDSDESDSDDDDEEEDENGEDDAKQSSKGKGKSKPGKMETSFAGDDFATDFNAHSPVHSPNTQHHGMSSSASFPSFPSPPPAHTSQPAAAPAALLVPPPARSVSNPPPPKPAAMFDMSAFADALIAPSSAPSTPSHPAAAVPPPHPVSTSPPVHRLSPPPPVSPRGVAASPSAPSGFDFFGGSSAAAASSASPGLTKKPPSPAPGKLAVKVAVPTRAKSPTANGAAAGTGSGSKKPAAPAAVKKKKEESSDEESDDSDESDSDDEDDDEEEDEDDSDDGKGKKKMVNKPKAKGGKK